MAIFELASDFVINHTLKPHINDNFRLLSSPGTLLHSDPTTGAPIYPKILCTGSGNAVQEPSIFNKLIELTGKTCPNVVYIGTPFFDREDKYMSGTAAFRNIGCRIKRLMVAKECTTPSQEEMRRIVVDWTDVIIISGGNSLFAMLRWKSIGLDQLIKESAIQGKILCGGSAGCGCYFDSMQTDSLKPEACKLSEKVLTELSAEERLNWSFVRIACLGFINAFCIPHIDTVGTNNIARVDIAKKMLLEAQITMQDDVAAAGDGGSVGERSQPLFGLGVDEKACIVYEGGKLSIYSAGKRANGNGQATCHVLFVDDKNEVNCIPITPNTGDSVTMEELIERAVRSVAALQSPLDLIVSTDVSDACHRRGCSGAIDLAAVAVEDLGNVNGQQQSHSEKAVQTSPMLMQSVQEKSPLRDPMVDVVSSSSPHTSHSRTRSRSMGSFVEMLQLQLRHAKPVYGTPKHVRSKSIYNTKQVCGDRPPLAKRGTTCH